MEKITTNDSDEITSDEGRNGGMKVAAHGGSKVGSHDGGMKVTIESFIWLLGFLFCCFFTKRK